MDFNKTEEIKQKIIEGLLFIIENYNDLAPEAKEKADKIIERMDKTVCESVDVSKIPESKEGRKFKRTHAILQGKHYKIEQFINALESSAQLKDENNKEFERIFKERLQNVIDFLFDVSQKLESGEEIYGQMGLIYMCIDELLAAFHLLRHKYINQAYSHIRTVFELLDKIELFRIKPEWFEVWMGDDEKKIRRELSPASVRKKLGKDRYDPIYGLFSTLGPHSSFKALQVKTAKIVESSNEGKSKIGIWYGGSPFEHNIVFLNVFASHAIFMVFLQVLKCFEKFLNGDEIEEIKEILRQSYEEFKSYIKKYFLVWAKNNKLDTTEFENHIDKHSWDTINHREVKEHNT